MNKDYEDSYDDFKNVVDAVGGLVLKAVEEGVDIAALMAGMSISLVRLAQASGIDKDRLKARLIRDIDIMYFAEAQFDKEKMQ